MSDVEDYSPAAEQLDHMIKRLEGDIAGLEQNNDPRNPNNAYTTAIGYLKPHLEAAKEIKRQMDAGRFQ